MARGDGQQRGWWAAVALGGAVVVSQTLGLALDAAASSGGPFPGALDLLRRYPWISAAVLAAAAVVLTMILRFVQPRPGHATSTGFAGLAASSPVSGDVISAPGLEGLQPEVETLVEDDNLAGPHPLASHVPVVDAGIPIVVGEIPREPVAFQPRPDLVERMAKLAESGRPAPVCVLTGGRGVGKTQLAAAYARQRVAQGWPLVAWISADSTSLLAAGLDELAEAVGVRVAGGDSTAAARAARAYLERCAGPSLVVLDNAVDPDRLVRWLPATGAVQVVVTSTNREFQGLGIPVEVEAFTRTEAVLYLLERTGIAGEAEAGSLADEVGCLPLALAQAAGVIRRQGLSFPVYLSRLRRFPASHLERIPGDPYPRAAYEAILLALDETERASPGGLASRMLGLLAVLSPSGVARALLRTAQAGGQGETRTASPTVTEEDIDRALGQLSECSIVTLSADGATVTMHRLTGRVIRDRAGRRGEAGAALRAASGALTKLTVPEEQAWHRRGWAGHLAEQVITLWEHVEDDPARDDLLSDPELLARMMSLRSWVVRFLVATADLTQAIDVGRAVTEEHTNLLGHDHPDTLASRNTLARAYHAAGRLAEAIPLYEGILADRERLLVPDHPYTLASRNNLASAYYSVGRLAEAIELHERTLADRERILGVENPDTLTSRNNLASAYRSVGRLELAVSLFQQTLADRERVLGEEHPDTLVSRKNLAYAYGSAGQWATAIPLYERALSDSERVLGEEHPDTLGSRRNLAYAYRSVGRLAEAIPLYEQVLADRERLLAPDHPETLASRDSLAYAYFSVGRLAEAVPLYEATLADRERVLGAEHPDTLTSRNNLASAYRSVGRLAEAIPLFQQTFADRERLLGSKHPDTLVSRKNLAYAYGSAGQWATAIPLYERALNDSERVLGANHPDTLSSQQNLAYAYRSVGRLAEAVPLYKQTLTHRARVLGQEHPDTLASRDSLAYAYFSLGRLDEAVPLYERTLANRERILGPEHPDTLTSSNNLASAYERVDRLDEAVALYERTLAERQRILGPEHPDTLTSRHNLAAAHESSGQLQSAIELFEQTLADRLRILGSDHPDIIGSRERLAGAYEAAGRLAEAVRLYERARDDRERILGSAHPDASKSSYTPPDSPEPTLRQRLLRRRIAGS